MVLGFIFSITYKVYSSDTSELSMKQALYLANKKATEWNKEASLYSATSVDNPIENNHVDGENGKRRYWNFLYTINNSQNHLLITINDGKIINFFPTTGPIDITDRIIDYREIVLDSSEAIKIAKNKYKLLTGKNWAEGYHFTVEKQNKKILLNVIGIDMNGYFTKIIFDATTSKVIDAIHKIPNGGGLYIDSLKANLGDKKQYAVVDVSISSNSSKGYSVLIWGYSSPYTPYISPFIKVSHDSGVEWIDIMTKVSLIKAWLSDNYYNDNTIFGVTNTEILKTSNNGLSWETVRSFDNIVDISIKTNIISVLTENCLEVTKDNGLNWSLYPIPKNMQSVAVSDNNDIYVNSNEGIFKINAFTWEKINSYLPDKFFKIKVFSNTLISYTDTQINIFNENNSHFSTIALEKDIQDIICVSNYNVDHQFYIIYKDGIIEKVGGDENDNSKINSPKNSKIGSFTLGPDKKMYFCTMPEITWEKFKEEN